jgi:hypothetical protein
MMCGVAYWLLLVGSVTRLLVGNYFIRLVLIILNNIIVNHIIKFQNEAANTPIIFR